MNTGLLILRIVVGAALVGHGSQKLFGWFGGHGPRSTGAFFEMSVPPRHVLRRHRRTERGSGRCPACCRRRHLLAGAAVVGVMLTRPTSSLVLPVGDERRLVVPGRLRGRSVAGATRSRVGLGGPRARTRLVGGVGRRERGARCSGRCHDRSDSAAGCRGYGRWRWARPTAGRGGVRTPSVRATTLRRQSR